MNRSAFWLGILLLLLGSTAGGTEWVPGWVRVTGPQCDWLESLDHGHAALQLGGSLLTVPWREPQPDITASALLLGGEPTSLCRCGEMVLAVVADGFTLINCAPGQPPAICGRFLDGTQPLGVTAVDDSAFLSVDAAGTLRRYQLAAAHPCLVWTEPAGIPPPVDLLVEADTLWVLSTSTMSVLPLEAPATGWQLSLNRPWQHLHRIGACAALSGTSGIEVINWRDGARRLALPEGAACTVKHDTLWVCDRTGQLRCFPAGELAWPGYAAGLTLAGPLPQLLVNCDAGLLAAAPGRLWLLRTGSQPGAELIWRGDTDCERLDLRDHRLLLAGLDRTRLFQLRGGGAAVVLESPACRSAGLTAGGFFLIRSDSLRWLRSQDGEVVAGDGFALAAGAQSGVDCGSRIAVAWPRRVRLYSESGHILSELNFTAPATGLRRCGDLLLRIGEQEVDLIRLAEGERLIRVATASSSGIRDAVFSVNRLFLLNATGLWCARLDSGLEPLELVPPPVTAVCLDARGSLLALGGSDGDVHILRYNAATGSCVAEQRLAGAEPVLQVRFAGEELAVLRRGSVTLYHDVGSLRGDARPEPELRLLTNPVRRGSPLRLELHGIAADELQLYDILGRHLERLRLNGAARQMLQPLQPLSPGVYFLRAGRGSNAAVLRFTVIE